MEPSIIFCASTTKPPKAPFQGLGFRVVEALKSQRDFANSLPPKKKQEAQKQRPEGSQPCRGDKTTAAHGRALASQDLGVPLTGSIGV